MEETEGALLSRASVIKNVILGTGMKSTAFDGDGARTSSSDKNAGDWRVKGGLIPMEKSNGCMRCVRRVHVVAFDKCKGYSRERKRGI